MLLEFKIGNIFESNALALVNPVNTCGVMGKGLAYQFKKKFPENFIRYEKMCSSGSIKIGTNLMYTLENNKIIINFPTKENWRLPSKMIYIETGLKKLKELILKENITSIAIPPLGAGNGGLDWNEVKDKLIYFSKELDEYNVTIYIYEPSDTEVHLTNSHLLVLKGILLSYNSGISKEWLSDLIFQKLFYFSDRFMQRNYFKHIKYAKGPFSKTLNILYKELKKYRNIKEVKLKEIEKDLEQKYTGTLLVKEEKSIEKSINLIKFLKDYYNTKNVEELEDKVELVATVIYIVNSNKQCSKNDVYAELMNWNLRKKEKYDKKDVENILSTLESNNLIETDLFGNLRLNM